MGARVYVFGFSEGEKELIDRSLEGLGAPPTVRILGNQSDVVLGDIVSQGRQGTGSLDESQRVVLFHELSNQGVYTIMNTIKSLDVAKPIFAVITEQSIQWTFAELLDHLVREREAFERSNASGRDAGNDTGQS